MKYLALNILFLFCSLSTFAEEEGGGRSPAARKAITDVPRPRLHRKIIVPSDSAALREIRGNPRGIKRYVGPQSKPGKFNGVLNNSLITSGFEFIDIKPMMHQEVAPDELGFTQPKDTVVDSYIIRNCATPIPTGGLDNHGSPAWDSLRGPADAPQPNQLRFLLTAPDSILNKPLRLELVDPAQIVAQPRNPPVFVPRPKPVPVPGGPRTTLNLANLPGSLDSVMGIKNLPVIFPNLLEIFMAWDLNVQWEKTSPGFNQAKVVLNIPYIPGKKSNGLDVPEDFYGRIVAADPNDFSLISTKAHFRIVHHEFCTAEHDFFLQAQQAQKDHAQEIANQTTANRNHAPFTVEVAGYEPPPLIGTIPGCSDGRFVYTEFGCAKTFPPYQGKGDTFWSSMGEMLSTISKSFEMLKHFVANLATQIIAKFTPIGWTCQGLDIVAGTNCADKLQKYGEQASFMAINAGLVYAGIPPSIPDAQALVNNGADYLAAEGVDMAASQMGVDLPPEMQEQIADAVSGQVKNHAADMEMQLRLKTIANSDRAKGHWYPEPLCEDQRLAGAFSGWHTPQGTVYLRVTKQPNYVGSDKDWKISMFMSKNGAPTFANTRVSIPNHWPAGKNQMIIPVSVEANFDYYDEPQDQLGSQAQARWYNYAWNQGTAKAQFFLDVYNSDLRGSSLGSCLDTLGIGCAPYPMSSNIFAVGQRWGMGAAPRLTRSCNAQELTKLLNEPGPY